MAGLVSINVGRPRTVVWNGRQVRSAIWKDPVLGPVRVGMMNLVGDGQADGRVHGGPDKAIYAYSSEDYVWWAAAIGPREPGSFGENLTTTGIDLTAARIGDRWRVGSAILEVSQPRTPCFKLGIRVGDDGFPARFEAAGRPGAYLRVVTPGVITVGDRIEVTPAEPPAVAIGDLVSAETSAEVLRLVVDDVRVPEGWRRAARRRLASSDRRAGGDGSKTTDSDGHGVGPDDRVT